MPVLVGTVDVAFFFRSRSRVTFRSLQTRVFESVPPVRSVSGRCRSSPFPETDLFFPPDVHRVSSEALGNTRNRFPENSGSPEGLSLFSPR